MLPKALVVLVVSLAVLPLAACEVRVQRDADDHPTDVEVDTPLGDVSVGSDAVPSDVGLPVYPGARPVVDHDHHDNANVSIDSPFGDVRVAALKFESDAAPEAIAEYYRRVMETYGAVTVCRGEIDFDEGDSERAPRCKDRQGRRDRGIQVAVGTEGNFRLAAVKPRGDGSEFAVVYVRASRDL
ncbi:MAG TPA: hypothetical protein VIY56_04315 [Vicinamibacterales bacterium]